MFNDDHFYRPITQQFQRVWTMTVHCRTDFRNGLSHCNFLSTGKIDQAGNWLVQFGLLFRRRNTSRSGSAQRIRQVGSFFDKDRTGCQLLGCPRQLAVTKPSPRGQITDAWLLGPSAQLHRKGIQYLLTLVSQLLHLNASALEMELAVPRFVFTAPGSSLPRTTDCFGPP